MIWAHIFPASNHSRSASGGPALWGDTLLHNISSGSTRNYRIPHWISHFVGQFQAFWWNYCDTLLSNFVGTVNSSGKERDLTTAFIWPQLCCGSCCPGATPTFASAKLEKSRWMWCSGAFLSSQAPKCGCWNTTCFSVPHVLFQSFSTFWLFSSPWVNKFLVSSTWLQLLHLTFSRPNSRGRGRGIQGYWGRDGLPVSRAPWLGCYTFQAWWSLKSRGMPWKMHKGSW